MELRNYSYRCYPSKKQQKKIIKHFDSCKKLYNQILNMRLLAYEDYGITLSKFDTCHLTKGNYSEVNAHARQNVADRVDKAYKNFFARCRKKSGKVGFLKFKKTCDSITYPQIEGGTRFISDKIFLLSKIGKIPIVLHRTPKGRIKTATIRRNKSNQWFLVFCCAFENASVENNGGVVGLDLGVRKYATLSDGSVIENPKHLSKSEKQLKKLQCRLDKKKTGSKNRDKARLKFAKKYCEVVNQRKDFIHKTTTELSKNHKKICVEDLQIKNMMQNPFASRGLLDCGWGYFVNMLEYKLIQNGGELLKVVAYNTSKKCYKCDFKQPVGWKAEVFNCPSCGNSLDRDLNAAKNILIRGTVGQTETYACGDLASTDSITESASRVVEAGTTFGSQ